MKRIISLSHDRAPSVLTNKAFSALFLMQGALMSIGSSVCAIENAVTPPAQVAIHRQTHPRPIPNNFVDKFIEENITPDTAPAAIAILGAGCTAAGALMNHRLKRVKIEEFEKLKNWAAKIIKRDAEPKRETDSNQVL